MDEYIVCPLVQEGGELDCMKETCAWWNPETNCCAVLDISKSLRKIARGK